MMMHVFKSPLITAPKYNSNDACNLDMPKSSCEVLPLSGEVMYGEEKTVCIGFSALWFRASTWDVLEHIPVWIKGDYRINQISHLGAKFHFKILFFHFPSPQGQNKQLSTRTPFRGVEKVFSSLNMPMMMWGEIEQWAMTSLWKVNTLFFYMAIRITISLGHTSPWIVVNQIWHSK